MPNNFIISKTIFSGKLLVETDLMIYIKDNDENYEKFSWSIEND